MLETTATETDHSLEVSVRELITRTKVSIKCLAEEQRLEKRVYRSDHRKLPEPAYKYQWRLEDRARSITQQLVYYHQLRETGKESSHFYHD